MLNELARYAEKNRLSTLPGYKAKRARWLIVLTEDGQYVDVSEVQQEYPACPHLEQSELVGGKTAHSHFLLDTLAVVTGYGGVSGDAKTTAKHTDFVGLLKQAGHDCPELALCAQALEAEEVVAQINTSLATRKAKPTDTVTFRVGLQSVLDVLTWRDWWQRYRDSLHEADKTSEAMVCLLSGEVLPPVPTHAKVSGLSRVGGQPSGSTLISFDKEAFTSYGFAQSANAACSEQAVAEYAAALNHLVSQAPRPLGGALLLHWYDQPLPRDDDPLWSLLEEDDSDSAEANARLKAQALLKAVRSSTRPELTHNRYFVLQVSGSGGRMMVRDWFNDDFVRLVESVNAWHEDLELVAPRGGEMAQSPKVTSLLMRLVSYRPGERFSDVFDRVDQQLAPVLPRLWRAILQRGALPDTVAQFALAHARSRLLRGDERQETGNLDRVACSILKVWLVRRRTQEQKEIIMTARLNKEHPSPAYQAGRLLAVLASLQQRALGDVGAGVVQRYFAAASTTPALVVGRLVRNAQYHLQKIESKGLSVWYEKQIAEIMTKLGDSVPSTLNLEGQTLFALGYYQQQAEMFAGTKATDADNETAAISETPEGGN